MQYQSNLNLPRLGKILARFESATNARRRACIGTRGEGFKRKKSQCQNTHRPL
jgi:hypothetical protein